MHLPVDGLAHLLLGLVRTLSGVGALPLNEPRPVPPHCAYCTLEADADERCPACGSVVHVDCTAEHVRVYHPEATPPGVGPYR